MRQAYCKKKKQQQSDGNDMLLYFTTLHNVYVKDGLF